MQSLAVMLDPMCCCSPARLQQLVFTAVLVATAWSLLVLRTIDFGAERRQHLLR